MSTAAIAAGDLGDVKAALRAQRNFGFAVGRQLPDQAESAALLRQLMAKF